MANQVIAVGTKATFQSKGWAQEISFELEIDQEVVENLENAKIFVLNEITDGYYDIVFVNQYNKDETPFVMHAMSVEHIILP